MHLYTITRGQKSVVDGFINDLQAQMFEFMYKGKKSIIQMGVRPMQIWEFVFPEDQLPMVQKMIWDKTEIMNGFGFKMPLTAIRKCLGAKKVPKFDDKLPRRAIPNRSGIAVYPIGIKPDRYNEDGEVL